MHTSGSMESFAIENGFYLDTSEIWEKLVAIPWIKSFRVTTNNPMGTGYTSSFMGRLTESNALCA